MKITITDTQQFDVAVSFKDKRGNPATLSTVPTLASSDTNLLEVITAADGLSATVKAVGPLGTGQVTLAADPDPNVSDDDITGVLDVEVISSKAVSADFSPSTPVEQP